MPLPGRPWDAASSIVANGTAASFASSPLFTARTSSLASLLSSFSTGYSPSQVRAGIENVVTKESYLQYPLILSSSLTKNFVSPDNGTMIVIYNFAVSPTDKMIAAFRSDVSSSSVPALGTYYVTGGAVLTSDISKVFGPVVESTVVPGVLASLAIVGLLLLAPLAAIIPVMIGGIAHSDRPPRDLLRRGRHRARDAHLPHSGADHTARPRPRRRLFGPPAPKN